MPVVISIFAFLDPAHANQSIGVGFAGEIHAVEFDANVGHENTIYIGGDLFGVCRTTDMGASWHSWSAGLENAYDGRSYYVDDIISVVKTDPIKTECTGVYAATHGGIYFREPNASEWTLQTDPLSYYYSFKYAGQPRQTTINFSTFGHDGGKYLFAGAGHARTDALNPEYYYTLTTTFDPAGSSHDEQYSLWFKDLGDSGSTWKPIVCSADWGSVRQIDVHGDRVVVAASNGVYLYTWQDLGGGNIDGTEILLDDVTKTGSVTWSGDVWGAVFDGYDRVYVVNHRSYLVTPYIRPGVFYMDLHGEESTWGWSEVGDLASPVAWRTGTKPWLDVLTDPQVDLMALSARRNPGDGFLDLMVGEGSSTYGGGFYHIRIPDGTLPETPQWKHLIWIGGTNWDNDDMNVNYVPVEPSPLTATLEGADIGWLYKSNSIHGAISPTVPMAFSPHSPGTMLAWLYHTPVLTTDNGVLYQQISSGGTENAWRNLGPTEMGPWDMDFMSDGRIVFCAPDWGVFRASSAANDAYEWLTELPPVRGTAIDVEVISDEVIALGKNGTWANPYNMPPIPGYHSDYERRVMALDTSGSSLYGWRDLECRSTKAESEATGKITYSAMTSNDTGDLFVTVRYYIKVGSVTNHKSLLMKGTTADGVTWNWDEYPADTAFDALFYDVECLDDGRVVVAAHRASGSLGSGGVYCFDVSGDPASATFEQWLVSNDTATDVAAQCARKVDCIAVADGGSCIYVGTLGDDNWQDNKMGTGSVLKLNLPNPDPINDDWIILANDDVNTFGVPANVMRGPGMAWEWGDLVETARRMTKVYSLVVDPDNPDVVYAGLKFGQSVFSHFHPLNGLWMYDAGQWTRIDGYGGLEPTHGISCLEFDPAQGRTLYMGTSAQDIHPTTAPTMPVDDILAKYVDRSEEIKRDGQGLSYTGTPYSIVPLEYDSNAMPPGGDTIWDDELVDMMVVVPEAFSKVYDNTFLQIQTKVPQVTDVTTYAPGFGQFGAMASVTADYNNDGWSDIAAASDSDLLIWRGNGTSFEQMVTFIGPAVPTDHIRTLTWVDYDRDGYADLYAGRGQIDGVDPLADETPGVLPDLLLQNRTWCGEGFVDVSANLVGNDEICTLASTMVDLDGDGDDDIITAGPGTASGLRVLVQDKNHVFHDESYSRLAGQIPQDAVGIAVVDLTGDGHLDLVVNAREGVTVHPDNGAGVFSDAWTVPGTDQHLYSSVQPTDQDLDGKIDLLLVPYDTGASTRLLLNETVPGDVPAFRDVTGLAKLSDTGPILAGASADWSDDGDPDLMLGKPGADSRFYFQNHNRNDIGGTNEETDNGPIRNWCGVRLVGDGGTNGSCLGANVTVTSNAGSTTQVVDGGRGLGGQASPILIFGLGSASTAGGVVTWPDGTEEMFIAQIGEVVTLADVLNPVYVPDSFDVEIIAEYGGESRVEMTWETDGAIDPATVSVAIAKGPRCPPACPVFPASLTPSHASCDLIGEILAPGHWKYTFTWDTDCLLNCNYTYTLTCGSQMSPTCVSPATVTAKFWVCLDDVPPPEGPQ